MGKIFQTTLLKRQKVATDTVEITFRRPLGFTFKAGQYIQLGVPELLFADARGKSRVFSIASSPLDSKRMSVIFRCSGSGFKQTLLKLPAGSPLTIEGPHGHFTFHENLNRNVVFIAGGIGITPFLSMIQVVKQAHFDYQLLLIYANKNDSVAPYLHDLGKLMKNHKNLHLINTEKRIYPQLLLEAVDRVGDEALWYLSGPPAMIAEVKYMAISLGIPENHILTDEFIGY